ncbi:MAG: hypothetical protein L0H63_11245 [Nitrococcus sp.]|nr:hypothetical protein [Nitrococcus sp.]
MSFSIDNPTIGAALIGAVTGAIISAFLTNAVRSWIERRTKRREAREKVAEDAMALVSEHSSHLLEFYVSHRSRGTEEEALRAEAAVRRSAGKLVQMEIRVWRLFPEWYATKAITKLILRANTVYLYFKNANALSDKDAEVALFWVNEQERSLLKNLSDAASINLRQRSGIGFLGFHKDTRQRRLDVLKHGEDDPPPWEPLVKFQFRDSKMSRERIEWGESELRKRLATFRCKEHYRAAHVRMIGKSDNFTLQIEGCCEQFATAVKAALQGTEGVSKTLEKAHGTQPSGLT